MSIAQFERYIIEDIMLGYGEGGGEFDVCTIVVLGLLLTVMFITISDTLICACFD